MKLDNDYVCDYPDAEDHICDVQDDDDKDDVKTCLHLPPCQASAHI